MGRTRRTRPPAAVAHEDLSPALLDERGRMAPGARLRELTTEGALSGLFLIAALAMAFLLPRSAPLDVPLAAWLVALCCVVLLIEFEVSAGRTRPVQLVLLPMLLLLPPALVPLLVAAAHVLVRVPRIVVGHTPARRAILALADPWFCVPPALLLAVVGMPDAFALQALFLLVALASQFAVDFVVSAVRLRVGLGVEVRPELTSFAWIYLVDALLTPVGLLAAAVGREAPVAVAAVLALAALLAVFARERRGRIDTALELHRVTGESEARLQSIVQHSSDLIAILERDGTIRTLTGSVEPVFGADWRAAVGTDLVARAHPEDRRLLTAFLAGVAAGPVGASQEAEWRIKHPNGSWRYLETLATNLLDDPRLGGIVLTARDVNDRRAFEEQLRHRAFHDPLTQLANRALFYDRIEHALTRDARDAQTVAVLYIDLDDFKLVNDERGHAVGDDLLTAVAQRLRGCLRSADTAARLGGDEFGILLENVQGPNEPVQVAERVLAAFGDPLLVRGTPLPVPLSVGITVSSGGERSVDELLRRADLAMYAAKRDGKRRWQLYDAALEQRAPETADGQQRTTWFQRSAEQREEIVGLLQREGAVTTVYQPILDLRTGQPVGYEALTRFVAPEQRPPNAWFTQAHRCGLGYELEARAIVSALATPGRPAGAYLTVNMSPSSLTSDLVQAVLPDSLEGLVIELTENELLGDDPAITAALADVRARGGRVAVDDAGAGYAGLKHVMRLAPDLIKLDRALVAGVHGDPVRAALIESFVRYAREIDATVCAEGIETLEDLERLADLDVTYGQGYVIARPAPPWAPVSRAATDACTVSFSATLAESVPGRGVSEPQDRRLERVTGMLSRARRPEDVTEALTPIAGDLHADHVVLSGSERAPCPLDGEGPGVLQVLAGDAGADPEERAALVALGYRSLLRMPVCCEDRVVGALEAYSVEERPWSRFEVRRARMIAHQLGAAVERVGRHRGTAVRG